ncbi:unnamed protein product [Musa acuminata subsp. malaccensis]|uniref:(wild Malaysian banana) hypothetical protein n=1 Tax=Musa acuminata subsp. malaccensis TaxID=214687 RepID=A0A804KXK9_MUSAM|nr:unnamed protein product [Musa acuminata subsp. malaccensis]
MGFALLRSLFCRCYRHSCFKLRARYLKLVEKNICPYMKS